MISRIRKNAEKRLLLIIRKQLSPQVMLLESLTTKDIIFIRTRLIPICSDTKLPRKQNRPEEVMTRVKDPEIAREMFDNILSGKPWSGELEMVTKSGRVFPAYERADAIKDKEGNIIGLIGIITDITEKQEFEKKILRDKLFADQLINSLPGLFYIISTEGKFVNWNKNLETVYRIFL